MSNLVKNNNRSKSKRLTREEYDEVVRETLRIEELIDQSIIKIINYRQSNDQCKYLYIYDEADQLKELVYMKELRDKLIPEIDRQPYLLI